MAETNVARQDDPETNVEEWKPSLRLSIVWNILGLALVVVGFFLFGVTAAGLSGGSVRIEGLDSLLIIIAILVGTLVVHEALHGLAMLLFGARPTFGVALVQKVMPVAYCTAHGHLFTRGQFIVVSLAPVVVMTVVGVSLMPFGNLAGWLIVPLAINLGGAIGDLWFFGMIVRKSPGVMIEDLRDGLRFHEPRSPAGSPEA